jgi:periplasmic protein TonB
MFEDSLFASAGNLKTSKPLAVAISFTIQSIAVGILVLVPLVYTEALPARQLVGILITPPPPPATRPPELARQAPTTPIRIQQRRDTVQPSRIPNRVVMIAEEPLPPIISGIVTDAMDLTSGAPGTLLSRSIAVEPPPPPPTNRPARIRVGGVVMAAKLINQSMPIYPEPSRRFHIQGMVRLQALISSDGTIQNLTVLSGHPMLIPAALDAVRQWQYEPTLLNGLPVEVETTIEVIFKLGG